MTSENKASAFPLARKSNNKPLQGVRVIDAGNMVAAPFATVLLADLGADVVKLEHPENGDGQRKLEPITKEGIPLWWKSISRNKRCVTLNLGKPDGAEIFKELCRSADVVVENYRPGTFERWGIGQDELEKINPKIVMLRISGFGQTGPYANRAGFGRVAEAMAGLTNLIGEADGPPMTPGYPLGDLIAGLFGAFSIMVALYNRDVLGGSGQAIDLALYESVLRMLDFDPIQYDQMDEIHMRSGNSAAYVAPSSTFQTSDGKWLTLAASTQSVWLRLAKAVEREDMIDDPRYKENTDRLERSDEVNGAVGAWIERRTLAQVVERFEENEVAFSTIFDAETMFNDAQYRARESLVRVPDSDLGEAVVQNVTPRFSKTPGSIDWLGPKMGAHNEEIYGGELGYSAEKLQQLKAARII
jgi:crotonobetainyl-CoA:carnitine CoA-transferase CaiB-like acyl-CoA transferase